MHEAPSSPIDAHAALLAAPELPAGLVQQIQGHMVRLRAISTRLVALQRAGAIGYHTASIGEEAVIVAAALAAGPDDWLFPDVRAWGVALVRGLPLATYVHHAFGSKDDPAVGHIPPDRVPARAQKVVPPSGVAGAHLPQAVGAAWAARGKHATIALLDAAALDGGDIHNALNFAGVLKARTVFVSRAPLGDRAQAYGLASARVDGGDALAVYEVVREALARPEGATLIEAVRDPAKGDPIARLGGTDGDPEVEAELSAAIAAAEAAGPPPKATLFDHVYASVPPHLLAAQRRMLP